MDKKRIIIAIDGPAGSGKSSCAKIIAKKLNINYVDSGAIYRAITKKIIDNSIKIDDYTSIINFIKNININLIDDNIYINDENLTPYIRSKEVTELVSPISNNIEIRKKVNSFLNEYAKDKSIIMDGRDIGTVVFPDAQYKFYLDASIEERAKRRYLEKNTDLSLQEIIESIKRRDDNDKSKPFGALKIADDAIYIDTTSLSLNEVVEKILNYLNI